LSATPVIGAGTLIPLIAAGAVTDLAGNPNTASTSTDNSVTYNIAASLTHLVISEFRTAGSDEFIEIYNPTNNWVDIGNWKISGSNNSGTIQTRATIPTSTILRSGQYYLVATTSSFTIGTSIVTADRTYGTGISDDGGIALLNSNDQIVDEVGMDAGISRGCTAITFNEFQS
jgi:predicted extracellular nuclease